MMERCGEWHNAGGHRRGGARRAAVAALRLHGDSRLALLTLVAGLVLLAGLALASVARADAYDQEMREIARLLRCPVCQNVSTADSQTELAVQMRQVIKEQLQEGKSRQEIIAYFVERYGESVLFEPPRQGFSLLAWLVTPLGVLAGALVVWRVIGRGARRAASSAATVPAAESAAKSAAPAVALDPYRARLRAELAEDEPALAYGGASEKGG